jgi:hypothetical protein
MIEDFTKLSDITNYFETVTKSHDEFIKLFECDKSVQDFIFDNATGLYLININLNATEIHHDEFMGKLMIYHRPEAVKRVYRDTDLYDLGDIYIELGMGMFKSRVGKNVFCSKNYKLPAVFHDSVIMKLIQRQ